MTPTTRNPVKVTLHYVAMTPQEKRAARQGRDLFWREQQKPVMTLKGEFLAAAFIGTAMWWAVWLVAVNL